MTLPRDFAETVRGNLPPHPLTGKESTNFPLYLIPEFDGVILSQDWKETLWSYQVFLLSMLEVTRG